MIRPGNVGSSACADDEYLKTDAQSKPRLFEQKKSLQRLDLFGQKTYT